MIRLNEVIWEITDRCGNGCDYCGSKHNGIRVSRDPERYGEIAQAIAKYPPREVNISGGDPLLVPWKEHSNITDIFKCKGIKSKIIVNPKSFKRTATMPYGESEWSAIIDLYDGVGVSVNTEEELELFIEHVGSLGNPTIITNFNKSNLWLFDRIFKYVKDGYYWQVQLTMYKESNKDAIYESPSAVAYLNGKLREAKRAYQHVYIADNFNDGECGAGMSSYGVLCNGDVIPCLSMVSWTDAPVEGNLLNTPVGEIWETRFRDFRFGTPKCCKDHCGRKCYVAPDTMVETLKDLMTPLPGEVQPSKPWPRGEGENVMMYAVVRPDWTPPGQHPGWPQAIPNVIMYAVFTDPLKTGITKITTTTSVAPGDATIYYKDGKPNES